MPRLSMVLEVTLAAVSSFGVFATEGRSAACAGRTAEYAMATSPART